MDKDTLNAAIAGCGSIAGVHASELANTKNARLISCCDTSITASRTFAKKHECAAFGSLKELFDFKKPDVLHICTPHYTHVPLAIYALSRGVHVVLEKPAATTETDLTLLQNAVKNSKTQLAVCFQNRYNPSVVYAKNLIASGEAGQIIGARAFLTWKRSDGYYLNSGWRGSVNTEGASVVLNQAIHTIDLLHFFLGIPDFIEGTTANRTLKGVINTEDTAEAVFSFNGINAFFYATVGYSCDETVIIELHCENMTILIEGDGLTLKMPDGSTNNPKLCNLRSPVGKPYWGASHGLLIEDFYNHILEGKPFPLDAFNGGIALKSAFKLINKPR